MKNQIINILVTILVIATITTLVLPGRRTPEVLRSLGDTVANIINAAMGRP